MRSSNLSTTWRLGSPDPYPVSVVLSYRQGGTANYSALRPFWDLAPFEILNPARRRDRVGLTGKYQP